MVETILRQGRSLVMVRAAEDRLNAGKILQAHHPLDVEEQAQHGQIAN